MLLKAYIKAIEDNKTTYSHNKGLPETREAIRQYFNNKYGFNYNVDEIIVTNGLVKH